MNYFDRYLKKLLNPKKLLIQPYEYKDVVMHYDPIKDRIMKLIKLSPVLRKLFFALLDMLFLRQWYVKKHILNLFPKNNSVAFYDAGAGFCQYSDYILSNWKDSKVLALDLKCDYLQDYSKYAAEHYPDRFEWINGDLVEYTPSTKFNLICAIDILEHIENDRQVLNNFYQCLEDKGKLIISTPSDTDEAAKFTAEHVRPGYSEADLKSKLMNAGFLIKDFSYSYGKLGKLSWTIGIKTPILLLSKSKLMILVLPIYYICLYPLIYLLMNLDVISYNKTGNGIIVVAEKPAISS